MISISLSRLTVFLIVSCWAITGFAQEQSTPTESRTSVSLDNLGDFSMDANDDAEIDSWLNTQISQQLGLSAADSLSVRGDASSFAGYSIRRIQQTHNGIAIDGQQSRLIIAPDGSVNTLLGQHQGFDSPVPTTATISATDAQQLAGALPIREISTELVYFNQDNKLRLSWQVDGFSNDSGEFQLERIYIDATNGEVIQRFSRVYDAMDRKVMDMELICSDKGIDYSIDEQTYMNMTGEAEESSRYYRNEGDPNFGSFHVDRLYGLLGDAYQFMSSELDLDGLDDSGAKIEAFSGIHYSNSGLDCVGDGFNAHWDSYWNEIYIPNTALDYEEILIHEMTHGVVSYGSGLVYEDQSGALNEAIADAIGISFRFWSEAGGNVDTSPSSISTSRDLWELREPGGIMRDLQSPRAQNNPDHFGDFLYTSDDHGGVHTNSSIINQAFYVLVVGGQHPRLGIGPNVNGIGIGAAAKIFAQAASKLLTPYADFENARHAFALAAELIHGEGSAEFVAVHEAMDVVGIPGDWEMPLPPTDPIPDQDTEPDTDTDTDTDSIPNDPEPQRSPPIVIEEQIDLTLYIVPVVLFFFLAIWAAMKLRPQYGNESEGNYAFAGNQSQGSSSSQSDAAPQPPPVRNLSQVPQLGQLRALGDDISLPLVTDLLQSREGLIIGRAGSLAHIVLEDSHVSRRHIRLSHDGGMMYAEDLNSSHGSSIDGAPITPFTKVQLHSGQLLRIAGISFRIDLA